MFRVWETWTVRIMVSKHASRVLEHLVSQWRRQWFYVIKKMGVSVYMKKQIFEFHSKHLHLLPPITNGCYQKQSRLIWKHDCCFTSIHQMAPHNVVVFRLGDIWFSTWWQWLAVNDWPSYLSGCSLVYLIFQASFTSLFQNIPKALKCIRYLVN